MATLTRVALNAAFMDNRVFCAGMSFVGIGITGTWVGTLKFFGQQFDQTAGMWQSTPLAAYSYPGASAYAPSGAGTPTSSSTGLVSTATANLTGNYFWPVQNFQIFGCQLSAYTSGTVNVCLAAAIDNSWADAFLLASGLAGINLNQRVGGGVNLLTIPANTNLSRRLKGLVVSAAPQQGSGGSSIGPTTALWTAYPPLQIWDGAVGTGTLMFASDLNTTVPFQYTVPLWPGSTDATGISDEGLQGSPGNAINIFLASPGGGITTDLNAQVGY